MELKGLKVNFLGDSITEGCGTSGPEYRFSDLLQRDYGIIARNYGIGGTRIARQQRPSNPVWDQDYCDRAKNMDKDADVIFVFGGTNDFGHGDAPFGSFEDRTPNTFYGACHYLMSYLTAEYPGKDIVIVTPLHRDGENYTADKFAAHPLKNYVEAIREVAEYYSLPVLDLWKESGISPAVQIIKEKYIPDGLHPNDAGHILLEKKFAAMLKSL